MYKNTIAAAAVALGLSLSFSVNAGSFNIDLDEETIQNIEEGIANIKDKVAEIELPSCEDSLQTLKDKAEENDKEIKFSDEEFLEKCEEMQGKINGIIDDIADIEVEIPEDGIIEIEIPECDDIVAKLKDKIAELPEDEQPSAEDLAELDTFCEDHQGRWDDIDWDELDNFERPSCDEIITRIEEKTAEMPEDEVPDLDKIETVCNFFEGDADDQEVNSEHFGTIKVPSCDEVEALIDIIAEKMPEDERPTAEDRAEACDFFDELAAPVDDPAADGEKVSSQGSESISTSEAEDGAGSFGYLILSLFGLMTILRKRR